MTNSPDEGPEIAIDPATGRPDDTVERMQHGAAKWITPFIVGVVWAALGWRLGVLMAAIAVVIRLEAYRTRVALGPLCYAAAREALYNHAITWPPVCDE